MSEVARLFPPSTFFLPFHQQYHLTSDMAIIISAAGFPHLLIFFVLVRTAADLVEQATASPSIGVLHYIRLESVDSARHLDRHRKSTVRLLDDSSRPCELTCCMAML